MALSHLYCGPCLKYVFWRERSLCDGSLGVVRRQVLDTMWSEFLEDMKSVDTAVHLRSFSHLNPLDEYRLEGSELLIPPPVTASLRNLRNRRQSIWRMGALSFDCDTSRLIHTGSSFSIGRRRL